MLQGLKKRLLSILEGGTIYYAAEVNNNMKTMRWLGKIVITSVFITSLTVLTTWHVVNLYIEEILRQYQLPALGHKIQFSDVTARLSQELNIVNSRDGGKVEVLTSPSAPTNKKVHSEAASGASPDRQAAGTPEPTAKPNSENTDSKPSMEDAVAVWGSVKRESDSESATAEKQREIVMSTEEFAQKKELLTNEDKMKIFSMVISKLPQSEVQQLSTLLEDGITLVEMQEVEQTLRKHLNQEEFDQLLAIINKY